MKLTNYAGRANGRWPNRILFYGILLFLAVMLIATFIFYIHYLHTPNEDCKPWNSDGGILIFTIFSALFTGLNVLAFIELTVTIEQQKDTRQAEKVYYDGLRYKQIQQKELSEKFDNIASRYISPAYFEKINSFSSLIQAESTLKDDEFTCLAIKGLGESEFATSIFPQVLSADLRELGGFLKTINKNLEQYEKSEDFNQLHQDIVRFYSKEGKYIPDTIIGIKEGILLGCQLTLFETMKLPIQNNIDTMPPKSQRYLNKQRREQHNI